MGTNYVELPEEVIVEILSRLPVKSVLRFRCLSKCWDALLCDPYFLKKHLNASSAHPKVLITPRGKPLLKSIPINTLCRDKSWVKAQNLRLPINKPPLYVKIVGCCNGLICLSHRKIVNHETASSYTIYFWNPSTNQSMKLPYTFSPGHGATIDQALGFGYDDSTNEFKLVRVYRVYNWRDRYPGGRPEEEKFIPFRVEVYGMWEGSRRRISDFDPYGPQLRLHDNDAICLNGATHWLACKKREEYCIVSFDLAKETFQQWPLPEALDCSLTIKMYCAGEFLSITSTSEDYESEFIWIMKEYGVKESWVKWLTFPYASPVIPPAFQPIDYWCRPVSLPIYFFPETKGGECLMIFHGKPSLYSSRQNLFQDLELGRNILRYFERPICLTYVDSLFTPGLMTRSLMGGKKHTPLTIISHDQVNGVITWGKSLKHRRKIV